MPPGNDPTACKVDRYTMWKTDGCSGCHSLMDPVGFGLENYDAAGRYRTAEPDKPECVIDGQGSLSGIGDFKGPAVSSDLMLEAGGVDECVATTAYLYAMGRWSSTSTTTPCSRAWSRTRPAVRCALERAGRVRGIPPAPRRGGPMSRRRFLRGMGGIALALPFLEISCPSENPRAPARP